MSISIKRLSPGLMVMATVLLALAVCMAASQGKAFASPDPEGPILPAEMPLDLDEVSEWEPFNVLVFSATAGFRHTDGIADGRTAMQALATANGFNVTLSEDVGIFTQAGLAPFDVVMFLNTTTSTSADLFNSAQQTAFENWYRSGNKGWVGAHAASDTEKPEDAGVRWPWYGGLLGNNAWFLAHGGQSDSACLVTNPNQADHVSVNNPFITPTWQLATQWTVQDEWYTFKNNPLTNITPTAEVPHTPINVVLSRPFVNNSTTSTVCANANYPASWYHEYDGGRAFYTARGHGGNRWQEPNFRQHVLGAVLWAAGADIQEPGDEEPPVTTASASPQFPNGGAGWYLTAPTVTLAATDNVSQPNEITTMWRMGTSGGFTPYSSPIAVTGNYNGVVQYYSMDAENNQETVKSLSLKVDVAAPTVSHSFSDAGPFTPINPAVLVLTANDASSGVEAIEVKIGDGSWTAYSDANRPTFAVPGYHEVQYRATDVAGNQSDVQNVTVEVVKPQAPTLSLVSNKNVNLKANAKQGKVKLRVSNPDGVSGVKVCVKHPTKVTVPDIKCQNVNGFNSNGFKNITATVKPKGKKLRGKSVKVRFTIQAPGYPSKTVTVTVKQKKK